MFVVHQRLWRRWPGVHGDPGFTTTTYGKLALPHLSVTHATSRRVAVYSQNYVAGIYLSICNFSTSQNMMLVLYYYGRDRLDSFTDPLIFLLTLLNYSSIVPL
jgi:hypothetical protein